MKKILSLLLALTFLLALTACTPEQPPEPEHVHEFVLSEADSVPAKCTTEGVEMLVCSCGEKQEGNAIPALGHDMQVALDTPPTCVRNGSTMYKCSRCGETKTENFTAPGHNFEEADVEASRGKRCLNEGCINCVLAEPNNKHKEALTFSFTKEDEAAIDAKYDEVKALIEAAAKYDPALHGYAETGALADEFAAVDAKHTELYDLVMNALSQYQLAMVYYYCDMDNAELEQTYSYMKDYQTDVIAKFYTLSRPFYDSCYRDFYYYGMTEEEIMAFLFDSDTISNPEYTALKERNNAIEVEFLAIKNPVGGDTVPKLFEEFARNNNEMAKMMGYDNYLDYAYENMYGRDYTYEEVAQLSEYVKTHISPIFAKLYRNWSHMSVSDADKEIYKAQATYSFFGTYETNKTVNDYIDLMAFDANPDKMISFSDEFNKLVADGNLFRGDYEGAFCTTIYGVNLPIAYFGKGYDNGFTVVHEFGHYMNEVYNGDTYASGEYSQSYDLLEMHSQGNELLYLTYLNQNAGYSDAAMKMIETYSLVNMFYSVIAGMTVDAFEQAIYLDTYTGKGADEIMADGTITWDEYDTLYDNICSDYGVESALDGYWRYGMTITSPCYYVSYSVSALSVLQLYEVANTDGFDVAKAAYLKLFTYADENPDMGMNDILLYADLLSFKDEQLYINLNEYFAKLK